MSPITISCNWDIMRLLCAFLKLDQFFPKNKTFEKKKTLTCGTRACRDQKDLSKECDFKLRIISNFEYEIPEVDYEVIRWSKEKEIEDLQGIDIGVYPLEDSQWVLGKSGLKAIQYMAFGIPTVDSNEGTYSQIIEHLKNGWLVDSEEEWYKALFTLINNPNLRRSLGDKAREKILKNYSVHAIKSQYLELLNKQISDEG